MRIERRTFGKLAVAGAAASFAGTAGAQGKPFTIGFSMNLTGPLSAVFGRLICTLVPVAFT